MLFKDYTGQKIGDFKVNKFHHKTKYYQAFYEVECIKCGFKKYTDISRLKTDSTCMKCNREKRQQKRFLRDKGQLYNTYKIIDCFIEYNKLWYTLKCQKCGKTIHKRAAYIYTITECECMRHQNGKKIAKHNGEQLGDFILHDLGITMKNNRNRLYEAECIHCGYKKQGQYCDLYRRCNCKCQKI